MYVVEFSHIPVLLDESIAALEIKSDGIYVDCTGGFGSHSAAIAQKLNNGKLICIDRDPDAVAVLNERFRNNEKVNVVKAVFNELRSVLDELNIETVDGILADLGVSSYQLDCADRGFSYHTDGSKLDMRMSREGMSAEDIVNTYTEKELADIFFKYGEEKYSRSIAKNIVSAREEKRVETTLDLVEIIKRSMPQKAMRDSHPARKVFQALRIEVNGELQMLPESLETMFDSLKSGGILAVISFHSLEDRIVKTCFSDLCKACICPPEFPICVCGKKPRGALKFKFISPGEHELAENHRSRSAKLRAIIKL